MARALKVAASVLAALTLTPAYADEPRVGQALVWGVSEWSCATWLSSPENRSAGEWAIAGIWSGMNLANKRPGATSGGVGWSTDNAGKIGEIKLICEAEPSTKLYRVVVRVYNRFKAEGR